MRTGRLLRDAPAAAGAGGADVLADAIDGAILCHDVPEDAERPAFRKGRVLAAADAEALLRHPWSELHLVHPDPGDVLEDDAGRRLAVAAAGEGTAAGEPARGQWPVVAARRGIVEVDADALARANAAEEVCILTVRGGRVVDAGEEVARARVIPLVVPEAVVAGAERAAAAAGGVARVRPFLPTRIGLVVQERLREGQGEAAAGVLAEKADWLGAELLPPRFAEPGAAPVAGALRALRDAGAGLIVVAGVRGLDPLDPALEALRQAGAEMVRFGAPAHPGSFFWLARLGEVPVVGMPGCSLFARASVLDLALPRLLAGERLGAAELAALGHGGLLDEVETFRLPPYRAGAPRGVVA